jgi:DNA recombination protein Rad52
MTLFAKSQLKRLAGKLDPACIQARTVGDKRLDYIEGWFAIAEANRIFGFAGWDREMVQFERLYERSRGDGALCAYMARVRIRVRAGQGLVIREGTGFGEATAKSLGEAHERALKGAETDATKRALSTFGNRFGLCLYDKDRQGVEGVSGTAWRASREGSHASSAARNTFVLAHRQGTILARHLSPEGFASGLRQLVEAAKETTELADIKAANVEALACLRRDLPDLKNAKGEHYADILERLIDRRSAALADGPVKDVPSAARLSRIGEGPAVNKAHLSIAGEERIRSKTHLAFVASKPCLVCEALPAHAHHLTFAQPKGLSLKVSDVFTVPLCALHHNEVHQAKGELAWWRKQGVEPLAIAEALWAESCRRAAE